MITVDKLLAQDMLARGARPVRGVPMADREGVFAHGFKCRQCDIEFVVFSWLENGPGVGTTYCPECGEQTAMLHWRQTHSESPTMQLGPRTEIFALMQIVGTHRPMLDDSDVGGTA